MWPGFRLCSPKSPTPEFLCSATQFMERGWTVFMHHPAWLGAIGPHLPLSSMLGLPGPRTWLFACPQGFSSCGGGGLVAKLCPTLATPWTVACQAPLFMEFSKQEYWSGLSCPSPWDLPNPRIKPRSPASQADSLLTEPPGKISSSWRV